MSSSSSNNAKAVVRRGQAGAVVTASTSSTRKGPPKTALEEDEFTDALTKIVRRDFFPDIAKLEAQLEFIEASETNDYERLRAISERFPTAIRTPNPNAAPAATPSSFETPLHTGTPRGGTTTTHTSSSTTTTERDRASSSTRGERPPEAKKPRPEDHSLDKFLSKFESEDDASFSDIMEKTRVQHRAKHAWLYEKEREYSHSLAAPEPTLAITDGSEGGGGEGEGKAVVVVGEEPERSGVKSWTYTAKNSLMYIPDGLERSVMQKVSAPDEKREVVHSNTRLSGAFLRRLHGVARDTAGEGEGGGKRSRDKVGVDGKVLDPSASPQVNGYSFVATPQIQPGVDASPLMTWGSIEGTPVHLETDVVPGPGPTFKMPDIPRREKLAHRLADKASKTTRERRKAAAVAASPALLRKRLGTPSTPAERLQLLSPAARKLASRAATPGSVRGGGGGGGGGGVDRALRQSYTPQRSRSTPSSTPVSTPRPHSARSTPRLDGSSTPSLTDNLLDLKNR